MTVRAKLSATMIAVAVIPALAVAAFIIWRVQMFSEDLKNTAVEESSEELTVLAVETIERTTTDLANSVADFLYDRDSDIRYIAAIAGRVGGDGAKLESVFTEFVNERQSRLTVQNEWMLSPDESRWVNSYEPDLSKDIGPSGNESNNDVINGTTYHAFASSGLKYALAPLYDEITFIGLDGKELIKIGTANRPDSGKQRYASYFRTGDLKDISQKENTFIHAENYWPDIQQLDHTPENDIYVSDVIGAYTPSNFIGTYTPKNVSEQANMLGYPIEYSPLEQSYAGAENPVGIRFEGIIRFVSPVYMGDEKIGYVSLALNHDHIMEFTDHITPDAQRYAELPDAGSGNYAFMWDYKVRCVSHPRHNSIYGYDPQTGDPQIPWLMQSTYEELLSMSGIPKEEQDVIGYEARIALLKENWHSLINTSSNVAGLSKRDLLKGIPVFDNQQRSDNQSTDGDPAHTPASDLTRAGLAGLDGRYLNNMPQCEGWRDITKNGGSGSFYVMYDGIYKLNTAAAIPYYTGRFSPNEDNNYSRMGFGFVTIGSGIDTFTRPVQNMANELESSADTLSTYLGWRMLLIILPVILIVTIASVIMSRWLSLKLNAIAAGFRRFQTGDRSFRFNNINDDEFGELCSYFDSMADTVEKSEINSIVITDLEQKIIYMNEPAMEFREQKNLDFYRDKFYFGVYPEHSRVDPFFALQNGTKTAAYLSPNTGQFLNTTAKYLVGPSNNNIGYIVETVDITEPEIAKRSLEKQRNELIESKRLTEEALAEADRASREKSNFLANMSHEMRTPLNSIIGFSQAQLCDNPPEDVASNSKKILTSAQTMLKLVNDVLDISKIEAGQMELNETDYDVASLINDTVLMNTVKIHERPIVFKLGLDENIPHRLHGDKGKLSQLLSNILTNAFKYTDEGEVTLSVRAEHMGESCILRFVVSDTGHGIKPEDINRIFTEYKMVDMSNHRSLEGTGLGLSIARRLCHLMDGNIYVESVYGQGSTFSFYVRQTIVDDMPIGRKTADALMSFTYTESKYEEAGQEIIPFEFGRVLVVDDIEMNLEVAESLLSIFELDIDTVLSGAEAIEAVKRVSDTPGQQYDIIFMDYMMPELDGIETLKKIRSEIDSDYARNVTIVALTANAVAGAKEEFLAAGFNDYMSKPIDIARLNILLNKYLRKTVQKEIKPEEKAQGASLLSLRELFNTTKMNHMDLASALAKFNHDPKTLLNTLKTFVRTIPDLIDSLEAHASLDPPGYSIQVHGLRGGLYGICADTLGDMATALESAGKRGNIAFLEEKNPGFIGALSELLNEVNAFIERASDILSDGLIKSTGSDREVLIRLSEAAESYDVALMKELTAKLANMGSDSVNEIESALNRFDYERIVELTDEYLNG